MRRLVKKISSLIFLFIYSHTGICAQVSTSVSAAGHVIAEVIPVFSATETAQLNFGRFSPGPQGGEIILTPKSTISIIGSVFVGAGLHNAASFYVSGENDASFTITLPSSPVILQHVSSQKKMIIENWMSDPGTGAGAGILQDGSTIVYVGATLKVGTIQDNPIGVYAGTYEITFDFN